MQRNKWLVGSLIVGMIGFNLLFALALPQIDSAIRSLASGLLSGLLAVVVSRTFGDKNEIIADERTTLLKNRALAYSWWITFVFLAVFFWFDRFEVVTMTVSQLLAVVFFLMTATFILCWFVVDRADRK